MPKGLHLEDLVIDVPGGQRASIDLLVQGGEQVAITCSRIAGRALLETLAGQRPPVGGKVLLDEVPAPRTADANVRKIGVVPEQGGLQPGVSVKDNVLYHYRAGAQGAAEPMLRDLGSALQISEEAFTRTPDKLNSRELCLRAGLARAAIIEPAAIVVHLPVAPETPAKLPDILASARLPGADGPAILVLTDDPEVVAAIPRTTQLHLS